MTDANSPADDHHTGGEGAVREAAPRADLLLIDNDATIRELVGWVLTRRGYRVRQAASFAAARELLAERQPDLLLSDVDLGLESALVELPRLAALAQLPPTLVVSGYLDADKRRALGALVEVIGFLDKPFDPRGLEHEVEVALGVARERRVMAKGGAAPSEKPRVVNAEGAFERGAAAPVEPEDDDGWIEIGGAS